MPGLWKIGRAVNINRRMRQLSSGTGVPVPFWARTYALFDNCVIAETAVHHLLADYRVARRREFFRCTLDQVCTAIEVVEAAAMEIAMTQAPVFDRTSAGAA